MEWLWFVGGGFLLGSLIGVFTDSFKSGDNSSEDDSSPQLSSNDDDDLFSSSSCSSSINPASGLPMIGNSCIDIEGNPFGTSSSSSFDNSYDSFETTSSSFSSDPFDSTI